jgi:hypothetical protein
MSFKLFSKVSAIALMMFCYGFAVCRADEFNDLISKSRTAYEAGNNDLAIKYLSQIISKYTNSGPAYAYRGLSYKHIGDCHIKKKVNYKRPYRI